MGKLFCGKANSEMRDEHGHSPFRPARVYRVSEQNASDVTEVLLVTAFGLYDLSGWKLFGINGRYKALL